MMCAGWKPDCSSSTPYTCTQQSTLNKFQFQVQFYKYSHTHAYIRVQEHTTTTTIMRVYLRLPHISMAACCFLSCTMCAKTLFSAPARPLALASFVDEKRKVKKQLPLCMYLYFFDSRQLIVVVLSFVHSSTDAFSYPRAR